MRHIDARVRGGTDSERRDQQGARLVVIPVALRWLSQCGSNPHTRTCFLGDRENSNMNFDLEISEFESYAGLVEFDYRRFYASRNMTTIVATGEEP